MSSYLCNITLVPGITVTKNVHMATIYVPFLNPIFKTKPLTLDELFIALGLSSIVFFAVEAEKLWRRRQRLGYN
ncbi:MAG: hypothetical protein FJ242_08145 [Nitrospira sp.]|nr:hypothetical protein [Nitrospira sp.]